MQPDLFSADRDPLDVPAPSQRRSHASVIAAERVKAKGRRGWKMAAILSVCSAQRGATRSEAIKNTVGLLVQSSCSLIHGAVKRGWLEAKGERMADTGCDQTIWHTTEAGLQRLAAWQERQR